MKRPIAPTLAIAVALLAGACGEQAAPAAADAPAEGGWIMPPIVDAVTTAGADLRLQGRAGPLGRVVVTGPGGRAYAAAADAEGRFDLPIPRPAKDTIFVVEARSGQLSYPAAYRLLVSAQPGGPVGLLSIGAPTRRLDPGRGLDAVDSDGAAVFLSGRAAPETMVEVDLGGARSVTTDAQGRWTLAASGSGGGVRVGDQAYAAPTGPGGAEDMLERAGDGWRIVWSSAGGARQTTWFPDRRPPGNLSLTNSAQP